MEVTIDRVEQKGDEVICFGTVDGEQVVCRVWYSHILTLKSDEDRQNYIAEQLSLAIPPKPIVLDTLVTKSPLKVKVSE